MQNVGLDPIVLRTQYRLHPLLSSIVNNLFYSNTLLDGMMLRDYLIGRCQPDRSGTHHVRHPNPSIFRHSQCRFSEQKKALTPSGREQVDNSGSVYNIVEVPTIFCGTDLKANQVIEYIHMLLDRGIKGSEIGVIVFYTAQKEKITFQLQNSAARAHAQVLKNLEAEQVDSQGMKIFLKAYHLDAHMEEEDEEVEGMVGSVQERKRKKRIETEIQKRISMMKSVQVSTGMIKDIHDNCAVDAFQGAEKEVIIMTTSRTDRRGFIDDPNRLNVSLTR